jgi:hypothetical protein
MVASGTDTRDVEGPNDLKRIDLFGTRKLTEILQETAEISET